MDTQYTQDKHTISPSHSDMSASSTIDATTPKYLNLAHQFLDSNFIESTKINKFTILPILSTNPIYESFIRSDPPIAVDYFSYQLTDKQYHNCWKSISNNQFMKPYELSNVDNITRLRTIQPIDDLMTFLPTTSQARLENACWRAWSKKINNSKELDPTEINWFKENDVTVLYGPLIDDDDENELHCLTPTLTNNYTYYDTISDDDSLRTPSISENEIELRMEIETETENDNDNDNESDTDSLFQRCSFDSTHTSISSSSLTLKPTSTSSLKSILKKRNNVYNDISCRSKKRISFSQELHSIRLFV